MTSNIKKYLAIATCLVAGAGIAPRAQATHNDGAAVIIEWNQVAQPLIIGQPFSQLRQYAMLHVAMADAVVAIEGRYEPFRVNAWGPRGASAKAAAAQAAHDVLVVVAPAGTAVFDAKLAADLTGIPPGQKAIGVQVGKKVAAAVIAWRANDGFAAANPQPNSLSTLASTLPGIWKPTASGSATYSKFGEVEPFGVLSPTQFLPVAFPQLESAEYAANFNEVKAVGKRPVQIPNPLPLPISPEHRTALLWAGGVASGNVPTPFVNVTNAFRLWYNVTRDEAQEDGLSLVKTARLFALVATSMHDSVQTSHTSKFIYRLWRPETAIPGADLDNNPSTVADATWQPVLVTPPYPSHSSNMQCIGTGAARMLRNVFGTDARAVTATWYQNEVITPPATTPPIVFSKSFAGFEEMAIEEGRSRVYGGIHFTFELTASRESCANVADYIFDHKLQQDGFRHFFD